MTLLAESVRNPLAEPPAPRPKPGILDISPYVGGKSKATGFEHPIKLSSNENALGCSPLAAVAYAAAAPQLNLYPDGRATVLRDKVAQTYGLEPERLVFGCGSDEIFGLLCTAYCEPGDNVVQGRYGFLAYRIAARAAGAEVRFAAEPHLRLDVDALLGQVDARTKVVFLANPSNPTGAWLDGAEVRHLHQGLPGEVILVLDGAYAEFVTDPNYEDGIALARDARNVVVTRTFSKLHGLAALRVGWAYCPEPIADALERIRPPFNVNLPALTACAAALDDTAFQAASVKLVETWRPWLTQQLGGLGLEVFPSQGNFVLVRFSPESSCTAAEAEAGLAARGVLVRGLGGYGLGDCLRITVGLEAHNRALVDALEATLAR